MMILKNITCLVCALCFVAALMAQSGIQWKEASSGGYKYRYVNGDPMKARFYTLKNGLTVIMSQNRKEPRIQTLFAVRAGSVHDPKDHTGLAHYLEHLLFKGTYRYGSLDSVQEKKYLNQVNELYEAYNNSRDTNERRLIYRRIDSVSGIAAKYAIPNEYNEMMTSMGAQGTNAHTSVEETVYEENIPSNAIDKFLTVQSERFRNPVFRLFHTELETVYEEKNRTLDNDANKVWEGMLNAMFPTHNYGQQTTIGTIEHLKNPSLKAIREYYERFYVADNMALILAGDFEPDQLIAKIDKAFSYMPSRPVKQYKGPVEKPLSAPVNLEVHGPDAEYLQMGYRLPGIQDYRSQVVLQVVDQLLTNGKAGLMDINLNKQQKVLSASSDVEFWKDYSLLVINGKAKEGQSLDEVKGLLLAQIDSLRKGKFDETLIKAIISNFKWYELQGLESNENRANTLMESFILHKGSMWDEDVAFIDAMSKVSKKDVVDFVNKHLGQNYVAVYKRKGENKRTQKVEKPPITPVVLNRDVQSAFYKQVEAMPANEIKPMWLDYNKEIGKSSAGKAEVFHVQNKDNDLFRLYYRFDMGNWSNRELGLAASYLQYLGTGKYSAEEISRQFYNIACNFSITPAAEYTNITITGLHENFDKAVKLFEDLILNCKPDEGALQNLKGRIVKARSDAKLNRQAIARGLTNYAVYGPKNPYNFQLNNEELKTITAQQLVDLLHGLFKYKHSILYYGPKPLATFTKDIQELHAVPASFQPYPGGLKFEKQDVKANQVLFTPYDMVQAEITWVRNSDVYDSSRLALVELFNNYFGGSMGSVVFQVIRESKALAYSTYAFYAPPDKKEGRYTIVAYIGSQADKMGEAIGAMNELLNDLPKTEQAMAAAKESIRHDIASQRVTQDDIIFSYLAAKRLGLESDYRKVIYEKVNSLAFEDLKKFHAENIASKPYTYCVIAARDKINFEELKKIGEVKELKPEEIFGY
jgi:predicted Zn-dependent peptidase